MCLGGDGRLSQPSLEVTYGDSKSFVDAMADGFGEVVIISQMVLLPLSVLRNFSVGFPDGPIPNMILRILKLIQRYDGFECLSPVL